MEPHLLNIAHIIKKLNSSIEHGLAEQEVQKQREIHGLNQSIPIKSQKITHYFFRELSQSRILLLSVALIAASLVGFQFAALCSSLIIIAQAMINAVLYFKAHQEFIAIDSLIESTCTVLRDNQAIIIKTEELVPGDLLFLAVGQRVPTDARLVEAQDLTVDESIITDCAIPVVKQCDIVEDEARLAERTNMVYKGSMILSGSGRAIVVATGMKTALAFLGRYSKEVIFNTPHMKPIDNLANTLFYCVSIAAAICISATLTSGLAIADWLLPLGALTISLFPQGILALWHRNIAAITGQSLSHTLFVQNTAIWETLGKVSVIIIEINDLYEPEDVSLLIAQARQKGIKVLLMSAHKMNALLPFAQEAGVYSENDRILDVAECGYIADEELMRLIDTTTVYAQCTPEYKVKVIKLFKKLGRVVAATGHTDIDMSVFKAANIGIARCDASDMVKEKADMRLLSTSFGSIILAIKLGNSVAYKLKWLLLSIGFLFLIMLCGCSIDYFSKTAIVMVNYIYR